MRSEERYGIIYALLLLLWGTLITEPLRVFTDFFYNAVKTTEGMMHINPDAKLGSVIAVAVLFVITIILELLGKSDFYKFMPCLLSISTLTIFVIESINRNYVDTKVAVALIIVLALIMLMHVFKLEQFLLWACDIYTCSLSVFLTIALIAKPLSELNSTMSKVMFAANLTNVNLAASFDGFLTLPAAVWGAFMGILILLPQIYIVFLGRRG